MERLNSPARYSKNVPPVHLQSAADFLPINHAVQMKRKPVIRIIGFMLLMLLLIPCCYIAWLSHEFNKEAKWNPNARKTFLYEALPPEATEAYEFHYTDNFPDSTTILKAKLSSDEFESYVRHFGIGEMPRDDWKILPNDPFWWNPSTNSSTQGGQLADHNGFISTKYENGYIYVIFMAY